MTVGDALETYKERLKGDHSLKERSKTYRTERIPQVGRYTKSMMRTMALPNVRR